MNITVPIFDQDGNETGSELIEVNEVGEHNERRGDGIGYIQSVTEIELEVKSAHMDDVRATLDNYYGYFNYQII